MSPNEVLTNNEAVKKASAKRTRRSFFIGGIAAAGAYEFYRWLPLAHGKEMQPYPLRDAFNVNEKISRELFRDQVLAPTYHVSQSKDLRVNGNYGLKKELVMDSYRLQFVGVDNAKNHSRYVDDVTAWQYQYTMAATAFEGHDTKKDPNAKPKPAPSGAPMGSAKDMSPGTATQAPNDAGTDPAVAAAFQKAFAQMDANNSGRPPRGMEEAGESDSTLDPGTPGLLLTMGDLRKLPTHELVTQFKCIEGWSEIVHWGGIPLRDLIAAYPPARNAQGKLPKYVYMETPDGDYYTGYHLDDCLHPQSTLVTEMAGQPLGQWHGAPIRLHMPIKYGYKQIKRIALIAYTDDKPDDYWTKLGYDWYAGL